MEPGTSVLNFGSSDVSTPTSVRSEDTSGQSLSTESQSSQSSVGIELVDCGLTGPRFVILTTHYTLDIPKKDQ